MHTYAIMAGLSAVLSRHIIRLTCLANAVRTAMLNLDCCAVRQGVQMLTSIVHSPYVFELVINLPGQLHQNVVLLLLQWVEGLCLDGEVSSSLREVLWREIQLRSPDQLVDRDEASEVIGCVLVRVPVCPDLRSRDIADTGALKQT